MAFDPYYSYSQMARQQAEFERMQVEAMKRLGSGLPSLGMGLMQQGVPPPAPTPEPNRVLLLLNEGENT